MQTPRPAARRGDPVEDDEGATLAGSRESDGREVLVGAVGISRLRNKFRTHSASLHDVFTRFTKGLHRFPN